MINGCDFIMESILCQQYLLRFRPQDDSACGTHGPVEWRPGWELVVKP